MDNGCIVALLLLTVVAGVVPNIEGSVAARVLSGFQGTYFHVAAQTIFADYFRPVRQINHQLSKTPTDWHLQ